MRKNSCTACYFMVMGVKTRRAIPHSCGRTQEQIREHVNERKKFRIEAEKIMADHDLFMSGYKQNLEKEKMKLEEIREIIKPETDLEKAIISDPEFITGAGYGRPRPGHPEGAVAYHIREVLDNVDKYSTPENKEDLRLIAIIHDTFKYKVDNTKPKSGINHHATIASRFAAKYINKFYILDVIELHDEAYNAWQQGGRKGDWYRAEKRAHELVGKLQSRVRLDLFLAFYKCDNLTGDKEQDNYDWFVKFIEDNYSDLP